MNKELEALKLNDELKCSIGEIYSKYNGKQLGEILGMQDIQSIIDKVKQNLTSPTADEIVKELLSKPYKVINDYKRGFIVTLFDQEVYVSNKFANQFENAEDSKSSILLEYGRTMNRSVE